MKPMSMLFTAAIFLGGAHSLYAQISPEMSVSELQALLKARGVDLNPSPTTGVAPEDVSKVDLASDQEVAEPLPAYVTVDNNPPYVYQTGACTLPDSTPFTVTGESMGTNMSFRVTVSGIRPPLGSFTETVPWLAVGPGAGAATGHGWILSEAGDTWDQPWVLTTDPGVVIDSIKIDVWHRINHGNQHAVFDIIDGITTPPSKGGFPFTKLPLLNNNWPSDTAAVYSLAVLPDPPGPPTTIGDISPDQDLYGILTINFPSGFSGPTPEKDGVLKFRADTDCMIDNLPPDLVEQVQASHNADGFKIELTGEGLVTAQESCGGEVTTRRFPYYDVLKDGKNEFNVPYAALKTDCCYSFIDKDSNNRIALEVDGVEMLNDEYCH